jgi:hypothetical protein
VAPVSHYIGDDKRYAVYFLLVLYSKLHRVHQRINGIIYISISTKRKTVIFGRLVLFFFLFFPCDPGSLAIPPPGHFPDIRHRRRNTQLIPNTGAHILLRSSVLRSFTVTSNL